MKKQDWLCLGLISLCMIVFFGYTAADYLRADLVPPEINFGSETLEISVQDPKSVLLKNVSATDAHDGDVSDSLVVESVRLINSNGTISITYAAFDAAGNVAQEKQTAKYTDYQRPVFSLKAPLAFPANSALEVLDILQAEDVVDGDISHHIRATSLDKASVTTTGIHEVEFKVTNSFGDTVVLVLPVEVYASDLYNASLTLTDYLIYLPVGASFDAHDFLNTYTQGAVTFTLGNGLPEGYSLRLVGAVDTATPGVYSVAYTLTSGTGTGYSRLIVVVEG